MKTMTSAQKRDAVKKNYDLIAEQYGTEFGTYIEDLDVSYNRTVFKTIKK